MNEKEELALRDDLDFLWKVHGYLSDMSKFADIKLGFSFGVGAGYLGYLVTKFPPLFLNGLDLGPLRILSVFSLGFLMMGLAFSFLGFVPRLFMPDTQSKGFIFWKSILAHSRKEEFGSRFRELSQTQRAAVLHEQIFTLALIVDRKFFCLTVSLWLIASGVLISAILVLFTIA